MADGFWDRQPPAKRPRPDFELPPGPYSVQEKLSCLPRGDDYAGYHVLRDRKSVGASYDHYLRRSQQSSFASGEASRFSGCGSSKGVSAVTNVAGGVYMFPFENSGIVGRPGPPAVSQEIVSHGQGMQLGGHLPIEPIVKPGQQGREMALPPDASNTLFVEGLPRDITDREVAHIFRHFRGYKEVRLVKKEPKYKSGLPLVLCFVDFTDAALAFTTMNALQGYKMDEHDPDSAVLRLQFSRFGPKPGYGSHGKR